MNTTRQNFMNHRKHLHRILGALSAGAIILSAAATAHANDSQHNKDCPPGEATTMAHSESSHDYSTNRSIHDERLRPARPPAKSYPAPPHYEQFADNKQTESMARNSSRRSSSAYASSEASMSSDADSSAAYRITDESQALPFPTDAAPGECYAEVIVPAEFETVTERVRTQDAASRIEVTPAEYKWVEKEVMVKPAETRLEIVPAQYKTETRKVLVEPAREEIVAVPATYKTVTEKVLVRPASKVWMDGEVEVDRPADLSGDVVCLVERPAEYKTVTRKVLDEPAHTEKRTIPAQYKTVTEQVLVSEATTRETTIPAQYRTVEVRELVNPNRTREINVDAEYRTVEREVLAEPAHTRWEQVLCEDSISAELAWEVESSLDEHGYNPGEIDGNINDQTETAIEDFQMANDLPKGGLTPTTLEELGIVAFES